MFDDNSRERINKALKSNEGVEKFFSKNHKKFQNDLNMIKESYKKTEKRTDLEETVKQSFLLNLMSTQKTLEMISDVLVLSEISFCHNVETNDQVRDLISIVQEKGKDMDEKLLELKERVEKHEPSLEWIDKFFEHETTSKD